MNQSLKFPLLASSAPLIPLVAMQFISEVDWSLFDFIVMGILLSALGIAIALILRLTAQKSFRYVLLGLCVLIFIMLWVELAVGIFGTPIAGS